MNPIDPSFEEQYTVTFHKRKNTSSCNYRISVDYGYDVHGVTVPQQIFDRIQRGEHFSIKGQGFDVEGETTQDVWNFNCEEENSLTVDGDDGHQIFIGKMSQAMISKI